MSIDNIHLFCSLKSVFKIIKIHLNGSKMVIKCITDGLGASDYDSDKEE